MTTAPLAVSCGDPAGVGLEVLLRAFAEHRDLPEAVVVGPANLIRAAAKRLDLPIPPRLHDTGDADEAFLFSGRRDPRSGRVAYEALETAIGLVRAGEARALVTAPVDKAAWAEAAGGPLGHTEVLAQTLAREGNLPPGAPLMLLSELGGARPLRVALVTHHLPLAEVAAALTAEVVEAKLRILDEALKTAFGVAKPRIALVGVNPHAGEGGAIGDEEARVLAPALEAVRDDGISVDGPLAADAAFAPRVRFRYDALLCTYHDQALAPFKAVVGGRGVNVTLGLPLVRTSPDHGVAFDIAGRGVAEAASMHAAIVLADRLTR